MKDMWLFTRPGFESEGGREWLARSEERGVDGSLETYAGLGLAHIRIDDRDDLVSLCRTLPVSSLVFTRDAVFELRRVDPLPKQDRVGALMDAVEQSPPDTPWGEVMVHVPEGSADKDLSAFARKWTAPVSKALRRRGWLTAERNADTRRLDLLLLDFERLVVAESYPGHRAAFPGGRVRLRMPANAPSRSVLKIEEAFLTLLSEQERGRLLVSGMTAVDLGAAPGGWTYFLVQHGLFVTAIDNGPMDETLMRNGRVKHLRADGFSWLPEVTCDWLVCDIVDKPRRTVDLVGRWFQDGYCRAAVFNLKLPMKKRLEEWRLCRERLLEALETTGRTFDVRAKQLYHDREEVTVAVLPG